jgi:hypothetical protein
LTDRSFPDADSRRLRSALICAENPGKVCVFCVNLRPME